MMHYVEILVATAGLLALVTSILAIVFTAWRHGEEIVQTPVGRLVWLALIGTASYVAMSQYIPEAPDEPLTGPESVAVLVGLVLGIYAAVIIVRFARDS